MAGQRSTRVLPAKTKPSSALLRLQSFSKASHEPSRLLVRPCTADEFKAFAAGGCLYKLARQWFMATPNIFFSVNGWCIHYPFVSQSHFFVPYLSRMADDVQSWILSCAWPPPLGAGNVCFPPNFCLEFNLWRIF